MKSLAKCLVVLILVFSQVHCFNTWAASLEELDRIVSRARNLDSFLRNSGLVEKYYQALRAYFGEQMTRDSFNDIFSQLKSLNQQIPNFGARMWETIPATRGFETPRERSVLSLHFRGDAQDMTRFATRGPFYEMRRSTLTPVIDGHWLLRKEQELRDAFASLEQRLATASNREKGRIQGEFYRAMKANPDYLELAKKKFQEPLTSMFSYLDGTQNGVDKFFKNLELFKLSPSSFLRIANDDLAMKFLSGILKDKLPTSTEVAHQYMQYFPQPDVNNRVISFKPVPRRIHGIWKGIPLKECVGGGSCTGTTPERWATIALKDSEVYCLESNGRYLGFVQTVPLRGPGNKIYTSIDYGATHLGEKIDLVAPNSTIRVPLYDFFNAQYSMQAPQNWGGIIQSDSKAINNAKIKEKIMQDSKFTTGQRLGSRDAFSHIDPMAQQIISVSPRTGGHRADYNGKMVLDATVRNATELRLFPTDPNVAAAIERQASIAAHGEPHAANSRRLSVEGGAVAAAPEHTDGRYARELLNAREPQTIHAAQMNFEELSRRGQIHSRDWEVLREFLQDVSRLEQSQLQAKASSVLAILEMSSGMPGAPNDLIRAAMTQSERVMSLPEFSPHRHTYLPVFEMARSRVIEVEPPAPVVPDLMGVENPPQEPVRVRPVSRNNGRSRARATAPATNRVPVPEQPPAISPITRQLINARSAEQVHQAQLQFEAAMRDGSIREVDWIELKNFLNETLAFGPSQFRERANLSLALYEIAAEHPTSPMDYANAAFEAGQRVLATPEFADHRYQQAYQPIGNAMRARGCVAGRLREIIQ